MPQMNMSEAIHKVKQHLQVIILEGEQNPKITAAVRSIEALFPKGNILTTARARRIKTRHVGGDRRRAQRRKKDRRKTKREEKNANRK